MALGMSRKPVAKEACKFAAFKKKASWTFYTVYEASLKTPPLWGEVGVNEGVDAHNLNLINRITSFGSDNLFAEALPLSG